MEKVITIFTPTYNRASTLPKLYESLVKQGNLFFTWLIVDDGSTDNTQQIIEEYKTEGLIDILYLKQQNAGKMAAHNRAVDYAKTELFFCVDSDDWLVDNAVTDIIEKWNEIKNSNIAGIVAYRAFPDGKVNGDRFVNLNQYGTIYDMNHRYHKRGDTSLIFRTEILRKYKYKIFEGEKFIPDATIYYEIDYEYMSYFWDKVLTIGDYLPGGYTSKGTIIALRNPKGYAEYKRVIMNNSRDPAEYSKAMVGFVSYSLLSKQLSLVVKEAGLIRTIAYLPGGIINIIRLKRIAKKQEILGK